MHPALCVTKETYREQMRQVSTLDHSSLYDWLHNLDEILAAKVQMKILERPQGYVLEELAAQPYLLPSAQQALLETGKRAVLNVLARSKYLTEEVHKQLLNKSEHPEALAWLIGNESTSVKECREILVSLKESHRRILGRAFSMLARKSMTEEDYHFFWENADDGNRKILLTSKSIPNTLIQEIISEGNEGQLLYLATNEILTLSQREQILVQCSPKISFEVFRSMSGTGADLKWVLGHYDDERQVEILLSAPPHLGLGPLKRIDQEAVELIIDKLNLQEITSPHNTKEEYIIGDILEKGEGVPEWMVERALKGVYGPYVIQSMGRSTNNTREVFEKLSTFDSDILKRYLFLNPKTPEEVRKKVSFEIRSWSRKVFTSQMLELAAKKIDVKENYAAQAILGMARVGNKGARNLEKKMRESVESDFVEAVLPTWSGSWKDFLKAAELLEKD